MSGNGNGTRRTAAEDAGVMLIFEYWRDARAEAMGKTGGPPMKPSQARLSAIRARLEEGYTPEQLKEAVDGCLSSENNVRKGFTDATLIFRDQGKVEQYRAWARNGLEDPDEDQDEFMRSLREEGLVT